MAELAPQHAVAYYTTANAAHYPGAVALVNSLRLLGDESPVFLVDCGLTEAQRAEMSKHATLVPPNGTLHPGMQKATGPRAHPAEVMVIIDADVIVNRPLTPLFEDVRRGRIVGFRDCQDRFFPEWSSLDLGAPVSGTYVNGGHWLISAETAREFFPLFARLQGGLDVKGTCYAPGLLSDRATNPFFFADQDLLNAVLSTKYVGRVTQLERDAWSYPPFSGLSLAKRKDRFCEYEDGSAPFLLHHITKKPWLTALRPSMYAELFTRVVTADDAPIRLGAGEIPLRLSESRLAPVDQWRASFQHVARVHLRGKLGLRPAIARAMASRQA